MIDDERITLVDLDEDPLREKPTRSPAEMDALRLAAEERMRVIAEQRKNAPPFEERVLVPGSGPGCWLAYSKTGILCRIPYRADLDPGFRFITKNETLPEFEVRDLPIKSLGTPVDPPDLTRRTRKIDLEDYRRINLPKALWHPSTTKIAEPAKKPITNYLRDIEEWISRGVGLIVLGKTRTGKSAIAALIALRAVSLGFSAYFTRVRELGVANEEDTKFNDYSTIMKRAREVDVLVLDDLAAQDAVGLYMNTAILSDLVMARVDNLKPTIITTLLATETLQTTFPFTFASAATALRPIVAKGSFQEDLREIDALLFGDK